MGGTINWLVSHGKGALARGGKGMGSSRKRLRITRSQGRDALGAGSAGDILPAARRKGFSTITSEGRPWMARVWAGRANLGGGPEPRTSYTLGSPCQGIQERIRI